MSIGRFRTSSWLCISSLSSRFLWKINFSPKVFHFNKVFLLVKTEEKRIKFHWSSLMSLSSNITESGFLANRINLLRSAIYGFRCVGWFVLDYQTNKLIPEQNVSPLYKAHTNKFLMEQFSLLLHNSNGFSI